MHSHLKHIANFAQELLRMNLSQNTSTEHENIYKWVWQLDSKIPHNSIKDKAETPDLVDIHLSKSHVSPQCQFLSNNSLNLKKLKLPKHASYLLNCSFKRNSMSNITSSMHSSRNTRGRRHSVTRLSPAKPVDHQVPLTNDSLQLLNNSVQSASCHLQQRSNRWAGKRPLACFKVPSLLKNPAGVSEET